MSDLKKVAIICGTLGNIGAEILNSSCAPSSSWRIENLKKRENLISKPPSTRKERRAEKRKNKRSGTW